MEISLHLIGPFVLVPQPGFDCLFDRPEAAYAGLYFWTVEHEGGYLINYIGETGRSIAARNREQVEFSYSGGDKLALDPFQFRAGRRVVIARFSLKEFLTEYSVLSSSIHSLYTSYRIFIAVAELDQRTRKYVEAGILRSLRMTGGKVAEFLDNRRQESASPQPICVQISSDHKFHGLASQINC